MAIMKEVFNIISCIPGFVNDNESVDSKMYQYRIHVAQSQLDSLRKKYEDDDHSSNLISLISLEVAEFETDIYSNRKLEDKEFMDDIVNFTLSRFTKEFGVVFDKKTYQKISKKSKNVFFKNYSYGVFLDQKVASNRLANYLIKYLAKNFIPRKLKKSKVKLLNIRDDVDFFTGLDYKLRKSNCKNNCTYKYLIPQ